MSLIALGINHRTAPVDIRERVVFPEDQLGTALRDLVGLSNVQEAAILSTCNRTEVYCRLSDDDPTTVSAWLGHYHSVSVAHLDPYLYTHPDQSAVRHIFRVAAGLDSMVLGEPQILGQMKGAFNEANRAGTIHTQLSRLFQHTFTVAKQVRTDTAIGASPVSVAFAAVSLAKQIFGDLESQTALLIGAGETIELAARHLHRNGIGRVIVANRTVERAHTLASQFSGYAIALNELPAHLKEADIIISSTASQLPILGKGAIEQALKARKHRPILIVDIAVPRDIEAEVSELSDVYLYTVDDLQEVIKDNIASRKAAARQAEEIIEVHAGHFMGWIQSLDSVATIRGYRENAEQLREEVLAKARQQLAQGKSPDEVLQFLATTLTSKLIHTPSAQLRQAGYEGDGEVIEAARRLLGVEDKTR